MGNIVSLPPFLPDEDYRSILFRYHLRSPYDSYLRSRREFGLRDYKHVIFPKQLSLLQDELNLSDKFIANMIQNHTYYPILRPFFSKEESMEHISGMMGVPKTGGSVLIHQVKKLIHEFVQYCPDCIVEDIHLFGECYIHRIHQLIDVKVCPKHQTVLESHCEECGIPYGNESGSKFLVDAFCSNGHRITSSYSREKNELKRGLIEDIETLFTDENLYLATLYTKLISHLGARGWVHFKGDFIYKKNVLADFIAYYGEESLVQINIDLEQIFTSKFLVEFLNPKHLRKSITFYILLARFLSGSLLSFINRDVSYSIPIPFGNGPWLCVNNICPFYNQRVILKCRRKSHEWITGLFTCPNCGLIYTRKGYPKEENEEQFSIETRGSLFIGLVTEYYNEGSNIEEIANKLLSNRNSVRKYLRQQRRKELSNLDRNTIQKEIEDGPRQATAILSPKLEQCKMTVLDAINTLGTNATRKQIRMVNTHRYDWVMRNDQTWMESNLPPRKTIFKKLNLHTLDDELYPLLVKAVEEINLNPPHLRIGVSQILSKLPSNIKARIENHKVHLKRTYGYLLMNVETVDQFLVRRFPDVIGWFNKSRYKRCSLRLIEHRFPMYKGASEDTRMWVEEQVKTMVKGALFFEGNKNL